MKKLCREKLSFKEFRFVLMLKLPEASLILKRFLFQRLPMIRARWRSATGINTLSVWTSSTRVSLPRRFWMVIWLWLMTVTSTGYPRKGTPLKSLKNLLFASIVIEREEGCSFKFRLLLFFSLYSAFRFNNKTHLYTLIIRNFLHEQFTFFFIWTLESSIQMLIFF